MPRELRSDANIRARLSVLGSLGSGLTGKSRRNRSGSLVGASHGPTGSFPAGVTTEGAAN